MSEVALKHASEAVRLGGSMPEINFNNYTVEDVHKLQQWAFEAATALQDVAAPVSEVHPNTLRQLLRERDGWQEEAERRRLELIHTREQLKLARDSAGRDVWFWQGDDEDHPESMGNDMTVVIRADQLRQFDAASRVPVALPLEPDWKSLYEREKSIIHETLMPRLKAAEAAVALQAEPVLRFNGDRASAGAIALWANGHDFLVPGEPNASYITTDGIDTVSDLLLAAGDEDEPVQVGDYVTREGGEFKILRDIHLAGGAGGSVPAPDELDDLREAAAMLREIGLLCREQTRFRGSYTEIVRQAFATTEAKAEQGDAKDADWMPIETAPEGEPVIVFWLDVYSDPDHSERHDFDKFEEGCWMRHEENFQHYCAAGFGPGPSAKAPYTHWKRLGSPDAAILSISGKGGAV